MTGKRQRRPQAIRRSPGDELAEHLTSMIREKVAVFAAGSAKERIAIIRSIEAQWPRRLGDLSDAVAVLAARKLVIWDPAKDSYAGLAQLLMPSLERQRVWELAEVLKNIHGSPEVVVDTIEALGGVDAAVRSRIVDDPKKVRAATRGSQQRQQERARQAKRTRFDQEFADDE